MERVLELIPEPRERLYRISPPIGGGMSRDGSATDLELVAQ
jgi:hypothetical protein